MSEHEAAPFGRTMVAVALATTVCVLPAFLLGSQGVQLRRDLDFSLFELGLAVALSWVAASIASPMMGRFSERIGGGNALRAAAFTSAVAQLAIAAFARSWALLAVGAAITGVANALAQPGANLLITRVVGAHRHGLAFAVKQSAIPFATLLGGLAVPTLTLTIGWRWTFAAGGVLALIATAGVPVVAERDAMDSVPRTKPPRFGSRLVPLVILATGVGLGAAAAGGLAAFITSGAVSSGMAEASAGWLLTVCSAVGISVRLTMGVRADRNPRDQLPVVAAMMALGAIAFLVLDFSQPVIYLIATPFAFGAGWAWPGLFNLSVVRRYPEAPGASTGITQTGTYLGAALGPLLFGTIVDDGPFAEAWTLGAVCLLLGAVAMLVGRRLLDRMGARDISRDPVPADVPPDRD